MLLLINIFFMRQNNQGQDQLRDLEKNVSLAKGMSVLQLTASAITNLSFAMTLYQRQEYQKKHHDSSSDEIDKDISILSSSISALLSLVAIATIICRGDERGIKPSFSQISSGFDAINLGNIVMGNIAIKDPDPDPYLDDSNSNSTKFAMTIFGICALVMTKYIVNDWLNKSSKNLDSARQFLEDADGRQLDQFENVAAEVQQPDQQEIVIHEVVDDNAPLPGSVAGHVEEQESEGAGELELDHERINPLPRRQERREVRITRAERLGSSSRYDAIEIV